MKTVLARRRYRLGVQQFSRAVHAFRWWVIAGFPVTFGIAIVFADVIETGAWMITAAVFQWFVGIWSGVTVHYFLPSRVAMGLTRREATVSLAVFGALLTGAAVLVVALGLFAEYALLSAFAEPGLTLGETASRAARYLLVTPLYCCTGLALGAAAVRMRGGIGEVLLLIVTASALGVVCMAFEYGEWWLPQWTPAGVALVAALAAAFVLLLRDAPVLQKRL
ncbi:hypothetical protein [Glycomyces tarimensis]